MPVSLFTKFQVYFEHEIGEYVANRNISLSDVLIFSDKYFLSNIK